MKGRTDRARDLELQRQTSSTSTTRHRVDSNHSGSSHRRRPSVRLLRQMSSRAGNSCMTALGLKSDSADASQKWNQRRLQLLAGYGNLRVSQLPTASEATPGGCRRPIDRQLSCPTPRSRLLVSSPMPAAATAATSAAVPLLHPPTAPSAARAVDTVDSGSLKQQQQRSLRRDSAVRNLYRGARSLSSSGKKTTQSWTQQQQQQQQQTAVTSRDDANDEAEPQLPPVPEEAGPSGLDFPDAAAAAAPDDAKRNIFAHNFRLAAEEMARAIDERFSDEAEAEVAVAAEAAPPPSPGLLARLRLSCLTSSETAGLKAEIDHHLLFRPYFTYWISVVQTLIFIVTVVQFGFAPFGITLLSTRTATIVNRNTLQAKVCAIDYHNLFIGPRMSDLIRVGAKYSLCMRRYDSLYRQILDRQRLAESRSGCCVHNDRSACYQSQESGCPAQMSTWLKWDNASKGPDSRVSGPVCGQDPRTCEEPFSPPGVDHPAWPDDVARWPPCLRQTPLNASSDNAVERLEMAHLVCPISARPCCVGIKGECVITSQQRCEFMRGSFFPDRQLCSQVNCIGETCGMLGVPDPQRPSQFYRVLTSLFLHSGLVTLAVSLVHHLLFLRKLEQSLGWHRTALIYIGSGVIGNLVSMIFLPYLVDVGPTSAQIGSLAPILIELSMSWSLVENKVRPLCLFILSPLVLVVFGFFPWFDNFANLGGLVSGLLLSVVLMPYVHCGYSPRAALLCRRISVAVCLTLWLALLAGLWAAFYLAPLASCDFCVYFNCGPKWFDGLFTDQSHVDYCGNVNLSNPEPTRCIETLSEQLS